MQFRTEGARLGAAGAEHGGRGQFCFPESQAGARTDCTVLCAGSGTAQAAQYKHGDGSLKLSCNIIYAN